jgi:hypothetical protein
MIFTQTRRLRQRLQCRYDRPFGAEYDGRTVLQTGNSYGQRYEEDDSDEVKVLGFEFWVLSYLCNSKLKTQNSKLKSGIEPCRIDREAILTYFKIGFWDGLSPQVEGGFFI